MATLAQGGRISEASVQEEIGRASAMWASLSREESDDVLGEVLSEEQSAQLDLFDRMQLSRVLEVCRRSRTLSEAGRKLFGVSRSRKTSSNDADRLRKYLGRFGIEWERISVGR